MDRQEILGKIFKKKTFAKKRGKRYMRRKREIKELQLDLDNSYRSKRKKRKKKGFAIVLATGICILTAGFAVRASGVLATGSRNPLSEPVTRDISVTVFNSQQLSIQQKLLVNNIPSKVLETDPVTFGFETALLVENETVTTYKREEPIDFSGDYTTMEGVITFRGNHHRTSPSYGIATLEEKVFDTDKIWHVNTGSLNKTAYGGDGEWSGSCWTGQPLLVRWEEQTRKAMNLYEEKKQKEGLTEVIYATCDGNIYFLDLEDGTATRDKISLGFPVKGTGSLYPSGVPLYFVGAGDSMGEECARTFIIDLIQGKIIYEYGYDDEFSLREDNNRFHAYDSSPLIDVETDTLIQPGENGILYTMKLNTKYDGTTVSISPENMVKWRYTTKHSREDGYWLGMESSAVAWKGYLYIADNCADLMCIDLNTMEVVWVQDTIDDTNASPVFEVNEEDGTAYLYISTSLHFTKDEKNSGEIKLFKINAATGEIVWEIPYSCETVSMVSGGVQATALLGDKNLSDLVYFAVARTGGLDRGQLVAIDRKTGEEAWHCDMEYYTWSSPVALYDQNGDGYIILCDSKGNMFLIDGRSGKLYDRINLGGANIEASPAAFENTIVVGTRGVGLKSNILGAKGKRIYGIRVK